mmetsp:Transcript_17392/g.39195  ORF Transcript_17392/g.39195 Transcript_17392/m.39195 type:complete len:425 (+) Transcript_17392:114-1388(+)
MLLWQVKLGESSDDHALECNWSCTLPQRLSARCRWRILLCFAVNVLLLSLLAGTALRTRRRRPTASLHAEPSLDISQVKARQPMSKHFPFLRTHTKPPPQHRPQQGHQQARGAQPAVPPHQDEAAVHAVPSRWCERRKLMSQAVARAEAEKHGRFPFVLLGAPDTGTNLIASLIAMNWPWLTTARKQKPPVWKHSLGDAKEIYALLHSAPSKVWHNISKLPIIITVRSPISQVASWLKAPYFLKDCVYRDGRGPKKTPAEMAKACYGNTRARRVEGSMPDGSKPKPIRYSSVMDVYNRYLMQHMQMIEDAKFRSIIMIPYEDMVYSPHVILQHIACSLGIKLPERIHLVEGPAKEHGRAVSLSQAKAKLENHTYINWGRPYIGKTGLQTLCPLLNASVVADLSEGTYKSDWHKKPYTWDCRGYI